MEDSAVVPFDKKEGNVFDWYITNAWPTPIYSRLFIQCRDPSAYPEQLRLMKGFIADIEDEINKAMRDKVGQSMREIEKTDALLCFTVSNMTRAFNAEMNAVNGLSSRFPILVQHRGTPKSKWKR